MQLMAVVTIIWLNRSRRQLLADQRIIAQANALKDYVLMRAAHELRTPLTTILGRTQLLSSRVFPSLE
jgi:signal transduction histidine kinase